MSNNDQRGYVSAPPRRCEMTEQEAELSRQAVIAVYGFGGFFLRLPLEAY
ncbi:hypothetical protein [Paenibacillus sanguinis]|nr:hypothetical protein [Paenibacillus sanguinis]